VAAIDYLLGKYVPRIELPKVGRFPSWMLPLLVVASTVLNVMVYRRTTTDIPSARERGKATYTKIGHRAHHNETVPLDGFSYYDCTFDNVTFVFQGKGPFELLRSDNPVVMGSFSLMGQFNLNYKIRWGENYQVSPLTIIPPEAPVR
jgi:hypothetical protein